jgi:hypothetical protein
MAIDVAVTEQCSRCRRKAQIVIPSDKVGEFEQKQAEENRQEQNVRTFVAEQKGALPDLVIIYKGNVTVLSTVCDAFCAKTVTNLLVPIFREPKERKPRTQKTPEEKAAAKAAKDAAAAAPAKGNDKKKKDKEAAPAA